MTTFLSIVGARPQFVKVAAVCRAFEDHAWSQARHVLVHTGQHYDPELSDRLFADLAIPAPAHHLGVAGGSHGEMTGRMLIEVERVVAATAPRAVIVFGDTNSTLAGALAAAKLGAPVIHVEAGLRSFDRAMPEEVNRVVTDHVSAILLCPTQAAIDNLAAEGIRSGVHHVGDVMYDAALFAAGRAARRSEVLEELGLTSGSFIVLTLHRAENTASADRLALLLDYVRAQAGVRPVVFPVHPRTRAAADRFGVDLRRFRTCPPVGYLDMARLLSAAGAVYTDSGGLQKEAYFHRVPCVTLRESTEWVETVAAGWNRLWRDDYASPRTDIDDYGSGDAGGRIVELLRETYG